MLPLSTLAQMGGSGNTGQGSSSAGQRAGGPATVQAAQQTLQTISGSGSGTGASGVSQQDYKGSLIDGKATSGVLNLSFDEAIQRGFKTNLGIILQGSQVQTASGTRLQQLQALLPTLSGGASYTLQQVNLAAYGLKFPGINPIVGPFQVFDFRAYLNQSILNVSSIEKYIAAKHNFEGAKLSAEDARNMVVLTVGNAYLL